MANLKDIRVRIASVQSTQKITSAMKMVAAAKLRRAQMAILKLRPYSNKLAEILGNIASEDAQNNPLASERPVSNVLLVLMSSNKGLCGGFNSGVIKYCESLLRGEYAEQHKNGKVHFLCIGKKVSDYVRNKKYPCVGNYDYLTETTSFDETADIAMGLMEDFLSKNEGEMFFFSTKALNRHTDITYPENCYIVFGREDAGLPEELLKENRDHCVRIPMQSDCRSLNLSNSVAVGVYEVLRQWDFPHLKESGELTKYRW